MQLTHELYHTIKNRYLTRSRIGDYNKCPRYFYDRHVTGEKEQKDKDCFKIGSAVDAWLTRGKEAFMREFVAVERRNLKNPPKDYTELTPAQFEEIVSMCEVIERQPAFHDLSDHKAQQIITWDTPVGEHFIGLAAMPDWIIFDDDTCIITDLKTSTNTSKEKYHYKCEDFGYYNQFALMQLIIEKTRPEIKDFTFRHLIIDKDPDVNTPHAFYLDNERINHAKRELTGLTLPRIAKDTEFLPKLVSWDDAETVGAFN
jgi:hypothetical protein